MPTDLSSSDNDTLGLDASPATLHDKVHTALPTLTPAEAAVARHLAATPPQTLMFATAEEIADAARTSDATVIRTIRRLGYGGLPSLRRSVGKEFMQASSASELLRTRIAEVGSTMRSTVDEAFQEARTRLKDTEQQLDMEALSEAVKVIASSERVLCVGAGISELGGRYLALKLKRLGRRAEFTGATGITLADALLQVDHNTAVVIYVPGRYTRDLDVLFEHCAASGAKCILITQALADSYKARADITILTAPSVIGLTVEALPDLIVTDVIVLAVATLHATDAVQTHDLLNDLRRRLQAPQPRR